MRTRAERAGRGSKDGRVGSADAAAEREPARRLPPRDSPCLNARRVVVSSASAAVLRPVPRIGNGSILDRAPPIPPLVHVHRRAPQRTSGPDTSRGTIARRRKRLGIPHRPARRRTPFSASLRGHRPKKTTVSHWADSCPQVGLTIVLPDGTVRVASSGTAPDGAAHRARIVLRSDHPATDREGKGTTR